MTHTCFWLRNCATIGTVIGSALLFQACSGPTEAAPPPPPQPLKGQLAFPGAVGFGALSKGGRNGRVIMVDTLADSGPGSFRACVEAAGPRVCIFRVAGVIRFTGLSPIISNPFLTIAGQTAPGGGVTFAHSGGPNGRTPIIIKDTNNIIVRHIRSRPDIIGEKRQGEDAFSIENSKDIIIDHVSGSWARDENMGPYGDNDRITISWSIFSEGIPKHDKCALLGSDPKGPQNVSFIGNLCAHHGDRNPDINFVPGSCVEVVNNLFYNAQSQFAEVWESYGGSPVSIVGNVFRGGRNTNASTIGIDRVVAGSTGAARIYLWNNVFEGEFVHKSPYVANAEVTSPPCPLTVRALPGDKVVKAVLKQAGAFPRDATDKRIVSHVRELKGKIVRQPGEIGPIDPGVPYPDADMDGMDDRWEAANGAQVGQSDPWLDANRNGLSNLDEFLDYLTKRD